MLFRCSSFLFFCVMLCSVSSGLSAADIITSPLDDRQYLAHQLSNGMQVLLISDPSADKAAAALDINRGSGNDPRDREGLAHFVEHMLFLGTKGYPEAGEYQAFIQKHGGSDNAYTTPDHTNYYFDVQASHLYDALDRFSQFFVAPLFNAEFIERERGIVDAEFSAKLQSDGRRYLAARRQAFNPTHPESSFAVGDDKTLADRGEDLIRDDLIDFYDTHYRAQHMALVVLGKETTSVLRSWIEDLFADIPSVSRDQSLPVEELIYAKNTLPIIQHIVPVKDIRQAVFSFSIPSARREYASKPLSYIANILGHEGPGSLLALLKERGWADGLSAGSGLDYDEHGTFEIIVSLTEAGLENYQEIGAMLFSVIQDIRKSGVKRETFNEQRQLAEIDFRFREDVEAYTLVRALAARMHEYPIEDLYFAPYRYDTFDPELILSYVSHLQPENLHLILLGRELETDQVEAHYNVSYSLDPLSDNLIAYWSIPHFFPEVFLPRPNPFIPFDLDLREDLANAPSPVSFHIADNFTLWFDHESSYQSPRGNFYVSVRSPLSRASAMEAVLTDLYTAIVVDQLNEFSYQARLAGLAFQLYDHQRGFTLKISGYTDKQAVLLGELLKALTLPEITPERFDRLRNNLIRQLSNFSLERPYTQGLTELRRLLLENSLWSDTLIKAAEVVTPEKLQVFVPSLLSSVNSVALAHGNYTQEEALRLADIVYNEFLQGKKTADVPHAEVVRLGSRDKWIRHLQIDHPDALSVLYFQGLSRDLDHRARFYLLGQILNAPFYHRLRTEQEMGYFVFCGSFDVMEVPGFVFVVQSPDQNPDSIEKAMIDFLQDFDNAISAMAESEFAMHKDSLIGDVMRQEEKLRDRSERYWMEIDRENYTFDDRDKLAEAIDKMSIEEFRHFFESFILNSDTPRISIKSYGNSVPISEFEPGKEITDPAAFRSSVGRFPTAS